MMTMIGNRRAQAATEYLIILAIVIVIALVVVGAMGGIPGLGASTSARASASYWQQAEIGVTASYFNTTDGSVIVKNNMPFKISVTAMDVGSDFTSTNLPKAVKPGATTTVTFTNATTLSSGEVMYELSFTYNDLDNNLGPYSFTGDERLVSKIQ